MVLNMAVCLKVSMAHLAKLANLNMIMNVLTLTRIDQEKSRLTEVK